MKSGFLILATLLFWALIPIFDKMALSESRGDPLSGIGIRMLVGLGVLLPFALVRPDRVLAFTRLPGKSILYFGISGALSLVVAQWCYYQALERGQVGRLFPVLFGGAPVLTMFFARIFLNEPLSFYPVLGGAFIAVGSALMFL